MLSSDFYCKENDGMTGAVLLHQLLPETGRQPGERFRWLQMTILWAPHRLRNGTTALKMAHMSVDSEPCSDRPSTNRNDQIIGKVNAVVLQDCCVTILHVLCEAVRCKRPELWSTSNWCLNHNNAPAHSSHLIQTFLANNQTLVVCQAPYHPNMAASL